MTGDECSPRFLELEKKAGRDGSQLERERNHIKREISEEIEAAMLRQVNCKKYHGHSSGWKESHGTAVQVTREHTARFNCQMLICLRSTAFLFFSSSTLSVGVLFHDSVAGAHPGDKNLSTLLENRRTPVISLLVVRTPPARLLFPLTINLIGYHVSVFSFFLFWPLVPLAPPSSSDLACRCRTIGAKSITGT